MSKFDELKKRAEHAKQEYLFMGMKPDEILELLAIQAQLVAALGRIYKNECEVFDEETNGMVICCMDTDDMMEVARAALSAVGVQP